MLPEAWVPAATCYGTGHPWEVRRMSAELVAADAYFMTLPADTFRWTQRSGSTAEEPIRRILSVGRA